MPGWVDEPVLLAMIAAVFGLLGAAVTAGAMDLDSRRDSRDENERLKLEQQRVRTDIQRVQTDSATAIAQLVARLNEQQDRINRLDARVHSLEGENADLSARLDASLSFVRELVAWVAGGCHGEIPQPHSSIRDRIDLSPLKGEIQLGEN